jgi:hypothetical protein
VKTKMAEIDVQSLSVVFVCTVRHEDGKECAILVPRASWPRHRLSKDRCVTSVKKLSRGRHLPSKCRSRDYSSFGSTSLPSKMFSTPFLQF